MHKIIDRVEVLVTVKELNFQRVHLEEYNNQIFRCDLEKNHNRVVALDESFFRAIEAEVFAELGLRDSERDGLVKDALYSLLDLCLCQLLLALSNLRLDRGIFVLF